MFFLLFSWVLYYDIHVGNWFLEDRVLDYLSSNHKVITFIGTALCQL